MEQLDKDLQKRVWQRVQSREEPTQVSLQSDPLKALILTARENNAAYGQLLRKMGQKDRITMNRMLRETGRNIAAMLGICRLRGESAKVPRIPPVREPVRRSLEKCYHRERKLSGEWERRASDPEHGVVFGQMAAQAKARCMALAEMLGRINM